MKIVKIISNPYTKEDLAILLQDESPDVLDYAGDANLRKTPDGMEVLKIDFWSNDKFWFLKDVMYLDADENTEAYKIDKGWHRLNYLANNTY